MNYPILSHLPPRRLPKNWCRPGWIGRLALPGRLAFLQRSVDDWMRRAILGAGDDELGCPRSGPDPVVGWVGRNFPVEMWPLPGASAR